MGSELTRNGEDGSHRGGNIICLVAASNLEKRAQRHDAFVLVENRESLDAVGQFANVSGPLPIRKDTPYLRRKLRQRQRSGRKSLQDSIDKIRYVFTAVAKRRKR